MALTLEETGGPLIHKVGNAKALGLSAPPDRHGQSVRTWVRSLDGVQKDAVTLSAATGEAWRFSSDEGGHLNGRDAAPNPLSFVAVGMVASFMNEVLALAKQRGIALTDPQMTLENFYYRSGSFPRGTMVSAAMPPVVSLACGSDTDDERMAHLLADAVAASPMTGLANGSKVSLFNLVHNGKQIAVADVEALSIDPYDDPGTPLDGVEAADGADRLQPLCDKIAPESDMVERVKTNPPPAPVLPTGQHLLHLRSVCRILDNGVKEIVREQYKMPSSTWRFLSEEAKGAGGEGRAPDAASYMAAGLAFCFMTQLGRYAHMAKLPLNAYRVVQDMHFSLGGASGATGKRGDTDPVETHVYMDTGADDAVAQDLLRVAERTCFLHALCRDAVKVKTKLPHRTPAAA